MNEMLVENLPNARELATTLELDISSVDSLPETEETLDGAGILLRQNHIDAQGGCAPYVQPLICKIRKNAKDNNLFVVDDLAGTGLTRSMRWNGVALDGITRSGTFRLLGKLDLENRHTLDLAYQVRAADNTVTTFWELSLNGLYGFVNLRTKDSTLPQPLKGAGNITLVPEVQTGLRSDIQLLARHI